ncbi:hypothetical protein LEP1GSC133_1738 [Leptospira borgpetersenii serovar Pomona str. 200901868]|uniref:Uncharacterized protein n=2 Tax=Leptospira borgpetersenii TaxID=174 RepID=M6W0F2_LEPBO|nr:hypothetical protein LEP1GSC133_1738 [Leptospira borgpetersenii serovar Pomona str. 200901868]
MKDKKRAHMNSLSIQIFQDIYHASQSGKMTTMETLEINTAKPAHQLRPHLEDLKESRFVVEHPEGFGIAPSGVYYYKSRWG